MYKYFCDYKRETNLILVLLCKERYSILASCISELSKIYKDVKLRSKVHRFLLDEIDWIKSVTI